MFILFIMTHFNSVLHKNNVCIVFQMEDTLYSVHLVLSLQQNTQQYHNVNVDETVHPSIIVHFNCVYWRICTCLHRPVVPCTHRECAASLVTENKPLTFPIRVIKASCVSVFVYLRVCGVGTEANHQLWWVQSVSCSSEMVQEISIKEEPEQ